MTEGSRGSDVDPMNDTGLDGWKIDLKVAISENRDEVYLQDGAVVIRHYETDEPLTYIPRAVIDKLRELERST